MDHNVGHHYMDGRASPFGLINLCELCVKWVQCTSDMLTTARWHPNAAYHLPALWQTVQPFLKIVKCDNSLVLPRLLSRLRSLTIVPVDI
jgi:hypothetical protein